MTTSTNLKPCPFCGSKADWNNEVGPDDDYYIEFFQCTSCSAKTDTIEEWNTRVGETNENC